MSKSRNVLASELFTLRSTLPLWRRQLGGESEFSEFLHGRIDRLLSEAGADDRHYVLTHVNQMLATHGLDRQYS